MIRFLTRALRPGSGPARGASGAFPVSPALAQGLLLAGVLALAMGAGWSARAPFRVQVIAPAAVTPGSTVPVRVRVTRLHTPDAKPTRLRVFCGKQVVLDTRKFSFHRDIADSDVWVSEHALVWRVPETLGAGAHTLNAEVAYAARMGSGHRAAGWARFRCVEQRRVGAEACSNGPRPGHTVAAARRLDAYETIVVDMIAGQAGVVWGAPEPARIFSELSGGTGYLAGDGGGVLHVDDEIPWVEHADGSIGYRVSYVSTDDTWTGTAQFQVQRYDYEHFQWEDEVQLVVINVLPKLRVQFTSPTTSHQYIGVPTLHVFQIAATVTTGTATQLTFIGIPGGGSMTIENQQSYSFPFSMEAPGRYVVAVQASDGVQEAEDWIAIDAHDLEVRFSDPVASGGIITIPPGQACTVSASVVRGTATQMTFGISNSSWNGPQPEPNQQSHTFQWSRPELGLHTLTVTATDGVVTHQDSVTVDVRNTDLQVALTQPIANYNGTFRAPAGTPSPLGAAITTGVGTSLTFTCVKRGTTIPSIWNGGQPLVVPLDGDHQTYTAPQDLQLCLEPGEYTLSVEATDGRLTDTATLTVDAVNYAPSAESFDVWVYSTQQNHPIELRGSDANTAQIPGLTYRLSSGLSPAKGQLSEQIGPNLPNKTVHYTAPGSAWTGVTQFQYEVWDGYAWSSHGTVRTTCTATPMGPRRRSCAPCAQPGRTRWRRPAEPTPRPARRAGRYRSPRGTTGA